jgi:tRNA(Arg) A34 adenosine deaminase TadA
MELAIEMCREGIAARQSPFGRAIALGDPVVSEAHNFVLLATDITAHAEINAVRAACQKIQANFLQGAMVATTCEPCPMCLAALHWARVDTVYFGAAVSNELQLPAANCSGGSVAGSNWYLRSCRMSAGDCLTIGRPTRRGRYIEE